MSEFSFCASGDFVLNKSSKQCVSLFLLNRLITCLRSNGVTICIVVSFVRAAKTWNDNSSICVFVHCVL